MARAQNIMHVPTKNEPEEHGQRGQTRDKRLHRRCKSPRGAELWSAYSSLSDRQTRQSFLRTLRSVVDYRDQAVSALNRLQLQLELPVMAIWGEKDNIIPVEHAYAAQAARRGSRL